MEEKKFVQFKKDELEVREFVKRNLGKGKISNVRIEYTPIGEKIIVSTSKPGFVIGRRGEKISELTEVLKKRFKLENPHIDIQEIQNPDFDAQGIADEIALSLEKLGSLKFKVVSYRMMDRIMRSGALGVELKLSGKLPSERARAWRFATGYLKKTGDTAKVVNSATSTAKTMAGVIGVKVKILSPEAHIHDRIIVDENMLKRIGEEEKEEASTELNEKKEKTK